MGREVPKVASINDVHKNFGFFEHLPLPAFGTELLRGVKR